ncbi:MAG: flippase-like domain-containing protein [Gemmatimonadales bacterium]|nr:MAG: flippase-like domain-containing protein [Gemmatimonadales bacterium]
MEASSGPRWRRWASTALKLVLTTAVTLFIIRQVGLDLRAFSRLGWEWARWRPLPLTASVLALAAGYALSASLWGRMVREFGGPRLRARESIPLFLVANLGRYIPGKVFQIAGLTLLARERGVSPQVAAGSAILGQGVALLGATLVGISAFLSPALPGEVRLWGWVGLAAVWAFVMVTSVPGPARRLESLGFRIARWAGAASAPGPGEEPILRNRFGLRWTLWYAMNWGLYATAFWLLYLGVVGWMPFLYVAPAFAAAYVGGYLALFAPAGLGIREGLLVAFLSPVLQAEPALALAVLARLWTTLVEVVPAALLAPGVLRSRSGADSERTGEEAAHDGP